MNVEWERDVCQMQLRVWCRIIQSVSGYSVVMKLQQSELPKTQQLSCQQ